MSSCGLASSNEVRVRLDEQAKVTAMASQGVVTYMLPVEAFVTGIKVFDLQKSVLDRLIICFWSSQLLDFWRVKGQIAATHSWSDDFSSLEVALIPWSVPNETLITWFNFDPGHKHFYMGHITYKWLYPLLHVRVRGVALTRYFILGISVPLWT